MLWKFSYDEYYVEMEKDFERYQNVDEEMALFIARRINER